MAIQPVFAIARNDDDEYILLTGTDMHEATLYRGKPGELEEIPGPYRTLVYRDGGTVVVSMPNGSSVKFPRNLSAGDLVNYGAASVSYGGKSYRQLRTASDGKRAFVEVHDDGTPALENGVVFEKPDASR